MKSSIRRPLAAAIAVMPLLLPGAGRAASDALDRVNRGVVHLETGSAAGASVEAAEDLASIVNDGATRRILPFVGKGGLQNLADLKSLHGIDMAILQTDVLDYAKEHKIIPGIEHSITYVAKLYNEELHLLTRGDIKSIDQLRDQKVNIDVRGAGTAITAGRVFELLKLHVEATADPQPVALERLRRGEIAALAFVAAKPAPLFAALRPGDGLHFLSIPLDPAVTAAYVPTRLTAADYPDLVRSEQPVDTIAVGAVLAVANLDTSSDRYKSAVAATEAFFANYQTLLEPGHHPKWRELNLAADLPGWRRFPAAERWLARNAAGIAAASPNKDLKAVFYRFVDQRRQAAGGQPLSAEQKEALFDQFKRWQTEQTTR